MSPATARTLSYFAVKRGELIKRLDVTYNDPSITRKPTTQYECENLGDLLESTYSGGTPDTSHPEYWEGDIPWISPKDFTGFYITDSQDYISEQGRKAAKLKLVPSGSVLVVFRSGILKHTLPVALATKEVTVNQDIKVLITRSALINAEYLANYLGINGARLLPLITKHSTTVQSINSDQFYELKIPIPPLEVQIELNKILGQKRDSYYIKLAQADALLAELDESILKELGLTPPEEKEFKAFAANRGDLLGNRIDSFYHNPHFTKWVNTLESCPFGIVKLGDISPTLAGGATPRVDDANLYTEKGVKFLRILNITPRGVDLSDVKYITKETHEVSLSRSQLKANDVLMTITGRVGTAAVVPDDILPANINQHIVRLRVERKDCLPEYLVAYLNCGIGITLSNRSVTGGTRIALDYGAIRKIEIPLPPIKVQEKIISKIDEVRVMSQCLRTKAHAEWAEAKASFEARLLGGE